VGGLKNSSDYADGGFGGGGGSLYEGGGGGGYHGGKAPNINQYTTNYPNYGAGSYNSGTNQNNSAGVNVGHGKVIITFLSN
jgi:hypothetical protein